MPTGELSHLLLATAVFLGIHIVPSSVLRGAITGVIGERAYTALYSLLSIAGIVWMVMAFNAAGPGPVLWYNPGPLQYLSAILVLVALVIGFGGLTQPSPTAMGGGGIAAGADPAHGFQRISRHPFMTSVVVWGIAHLIVRGDLRAIIFFGGFTVLAAVGTLLIDAKQKARRGADWNRYAAVTSVIPFLAILSGRNRLSLREIGWWRPLVAIVIWAAIMHFHAALMGVYPIPMHGG
ncbi:MAG: NnrU family protein [Pseudomonadota bacterium]|nr:NnrU family protein [Pseudomonadota bacterium]